MLANGNSRLRWGIAGCGRIANDFCRAMKTIPGDKHMVELVAARPEDEPVIFASTHAIGRASTSYELLAKDENVDIVYIAVIHTEHVRLSRMMLEHGKRVLCEKPMTLGSKDCREVLDLAKKKGLFFMEGLWSRFLPTYIAVADSISNREIGDVKLVHALAYLNLDHHPRICSRELAGGGLYDMGIYGISLATLVYCERPVSIIAEGELMNSGVDLSACVTMKYRNGGIFQMAYHVGVKRPNNYAQIIGTEGHIEMRSPFWSSPEVQTPSGRVCLDLKDDKSLYNCVNTEGLKYEIEAVRECLIEGKLESAVASHDHSLIISEVLEEVARQLGVNFTDII